MSKFTHGECECRNGCRCACYAGPAAYEVIRNGKTMKVCTRCDLSSDVATRKLLVTEDESGGEYGRWDSLGLFCILGELARRREGSESVAKEAEVE